jgi:hypothetical protein
MGLLRGLAMTEKDGVDPGFVDVLILTVYFQVSIGVLLHRGVKWVLMSAFSR